MGAGDWGLEAGDWGMGNGEWGFGNGESGADVGTSCPLSAYRFPNLLIVFLNDLNNQLWTRESGIGNRKADSRQPTAGSR